jgi:ATP-dependent DNA helicase RecG
MTMKSSYDGYAIAEKDLAMRGPGDFLRAGADVGVRQSGGVRFRLGELCDDTGLLATALSEAKTLLAEDPTLAKHPALEQHVKHLFLPEKGTIN